MDKRVSYERIYDQLNKLFAGCADPQARMATINALLYHKVSYIFWCGFYLLKAEDLIVGPYQGPLACMQLARNRGVCRAAIQAKQTIIVNDVHKFPDHIACDPRSKSEIVVPVFDRSKQLIGVLDIDSDRLASFDQTDAEWLEKIVALIYGPT